MRQRKCAALVWTLVALAAIGFVLVGAALPRSPANAQDPSLRVGVATWKTSDGIIELCIDLRDDARGDARICPDLRELNVAAVSEHRWFRSRAVEIGPGASLWVRARRIGDRLDFGLGIRSDGRSRGLRAATWSFDWRQRLANRWQRSSSIVLPLSVAPYSRLFATSAGMLSDAPQLELGQPAPEFALPLLGGEPETLISLFDARSGGARHTLLVFWASWAPHADETLAMLSELESKSADVRVVAINVYEPSQRDAQQSARDHGARILHLIDETGSVARHYRVDGLPEIYVLDRSGCVPVRDSRAGPAV